MEFLSWNIGGRSCGCNCWLIGQQGHGDTGRVTLSCCVSMARKITSPLSDTLKLAFLSIANIPIKKCCRIKCEHCTCGQPSSKGVRIKTYFGFDVFWLEPSGKVSFHVSTGMWLGTVTFVPTLAPTLTFPFPFSLTLEPTSIFLFSPLITLESPVVIIVAFWFDILGFGFFLTLFWSIVLFSSRLTLC